MIRIGKFLGKLVLVLGFSILQTIVFFVILFFLERFGIAMIEVSWYNSKLIYPTELGGFFFVLIFISDIVIEGIRGLIKK